MASSILGQFLFSYHEPSGKPAAPNGHTRTASLNPLPGTGRPKGGSSQRGGEMRRCVLCACWAPGTAGFPEGSGEKKQ